MSISTTSITDGATGPTQPAGTDAAELEREWLAWRAQRHAGLRAPRGVLSLTSHHWLGAEPARLPGVPGEWWADADGAHVRPAGAAASTDAPVARPLDVLLDADSLEPVDVERTVVVAEAGSAAPFLVGAGLVTPETAQDLVAVELALRTGRYLLRTRDPHAAALAAAESADPVPSFGFDAAWLLDAPVRWYDEPRADVVPGAKAGLIHHVQVVGETDLTGPDGQVVTLRLAAGHAGGVTLAFTDRADDVPAWRAVHVDAAAAGAARETGTLRLDLNRATAYPSHFNDHGTCPQPLDGNDLPFAVEAGEKDPR
jgi:hypothetical protein